MNNKVFRRHLADVFNKCVQVERSEIFGENDPIPLKQQDDARVMFAGLVTREYIPSKGVLIMALNPAGGGDEDSRTASDHALYKAMYKFKIAKADEIYEAFEKLNDVAYVSERSWNGLSKHICAILQATCSADNHAYINAIPYRTRGDNSSDLSQEYFQKSFEKVVSKQIKILKPRTIVILGKRTNDLVGSYYKDKAEKVYVVPGTPGWTYIKKEAREMIDKIAAEFGKPLVFGKSFSNSKSSTKSEKKQKKARQTVSRNMRGHLYVTTEVEALNELKNGKFIDAKEDYRNKFKKSDIFPFFLKLLTEEFKEYPVNYISFLNCTGKGNWQSFIPNAMSSGKSFVHDYCRVNYETLVLYKKDGQIIIKEGKQKSS